MDTYIREAPDDRREALSKIRDICLKELKGYTEIMKYGGPCYEKNHVVEIGFGNQKHFIGLYILKKDVMDQYKGLLKGVSVGKGAIRFGNPKKIDFDVVEKMVRGTFLSTNTICG